ncbi:MAG: hypothetical protein AB1916_06825 [Thermodesulfobacteriota bacterium]
MYRYNVDTMNLLSKPICESNRKTLVKWFSEQPESIKIALIVKFWKKIFPRYDFTSPGEIKPEAIFAALCRALEEAYRLVETERIKSPKIHHLAEKHNLAIAKAIAAARPKGGRKKANKRENLWAHLALIRKMREEDGLSFSIITAYINQNIPEYRRSKKHNITPQYLSKVYHLMVMDDDFGIRMGGSIQAKKGDRPNQE